MPKNASEAARSSFGIYLTLENNTASANYSAFKPSAMKYNAFFSYSHAADGKLATVIHDELQRLATPWYRVRRIRIFRDQRSLGATPALKSAIFKGLAQSEYLILFASPESASSQWVADELTWWKENRGSDRLIIVVTGGHLQWSVANGDFAFPETTAISPIIRGWLTAEPLWIDFRWAHSDTELSLRHAKFRSTVLDIAAPLLDTDKDTLDGEDVRQHKKNQRWAWSGASVLVLLMLLASTLAVIADRERDIARKRLREVLIEDARQQLLGGSAEDVTHTLAPLENIGDEADPVFATVRELSRSFSFHQIISRADAGEGRDNCAALSRGGRYLAIGDAQKNLKLVDLSQSLAHSQSADDPNENVVLQPIGKWPTQGCDDNGGDGTPKTIFSPDGTRLLVIDHHIARAIRTAGMTVDHEFRSGNEVLDAQYHPNADWVYTSDNRGVIIWDGKSGKIRQTLPGVTWFAWDRRAKTYFSLDLAGNLKFTDAQTGQVIKSIKQAVPPSWLKKRGTDSDRNAISVRSATLMQASWDGERIVIATPHGVRIFATHQNMQGTIPVSTSIRSLDVGSRAARIALGTSETTAIYFLSDCPGLSADQLCYSAPVTLALRGDFNASLNSHLVRFTPNGEFAYTTGSRGLVTVWNPVDGTPIAEIGRAPATYGTFFAALDPEGKHLVAIANEHIGSGRPLYSSSASVRGRRRSESQLRRGRRIAPIFSAITDRCCS